MPGSLYNHIENDACQETRAMNTIFVIIIGVLSLCVLVCSIFSILILVQIARKEGAGQFLLGLFIPIYAFIWGWVKSEKYDLRKTMWGWTVSLLAEIVFALAALMGLLLWMPGTIRSTQPDISSKIASLTITTYDGHTLHLADSRGQVVVINFWASWCTPCEKDVPVMERIWQEYGDDNVLVIGIDYLDTQSKALDFIQRFDLSYPIGPDIGTDISATFNISGVPETFILDKKGVIAEHITGPADYVQLSQIIEELLQK